MVYYYVLDVSQAKLPRANEEYPLKDIVSEDITNYVVDNGLKSLYPKYIKRLAKSKKATFKEVLCDVFVSYLDMEHEVTRNICPGKKYKRNTEKFSNSFIEQYTKDHDSLITSFKEGDVQPCVKTEADTVYYNMQKLLKAIKNKINE